MSESIRHQAKVIQTFDDAVEVMVVAESACTSCRVKGQCGMGESREKVMIVETPEARFFEPGEVVDLYMEQIMGMKAVFFAYVLPFFVVMIALLTLLQSGCSDLIAGVTALILLGLYYAALCLFRRKLSKEIVFTVKKCGT